MKKCKTRTIIVTAPVQRLSSLGFHGPGRVRRRKGRGCRGRVYQVGPLCCPPWGLSSLFSPFVVRFVLAPVPFLCPIALTANEGVSQGYRFPSVNAGRANKIKHKGKTQGFLPGVSPSPSPFVCLERSPLIVWAFPSYRDPLEISHPSLICRRRYYMTKQQPPLCCGA